MNPTCWPSQKSPDLEYYEYLAAEFPKAPTLDDMVWRGLMTRTTKEWLGCSSHSWSRVSEAYLRHLLRKESLLSWLIFHVIVGLPVTTLISQMNLTGLKWNKFATSEERWLAFILSLTWCMICNRIGKVFLISTHLLWIRFSSSSRFCHVVYARRDSGRAD